MKTRIKIPTKDGLKYAFGTVAWFQIGDKKIKFLLQNTGSYSTPHSTPQLTHFASGHTFGKLEWIKHQYIIAGRDISNRDAAKIRIEKTIKKHGVKKVLATIASAEIIN